MDALKLRRFLSVDDGKHGSGSGYGSGCGHGYGCGSGSGFEHGAGYGSGYGSGSGSGFEHGARAGAGYGSGYGYGSGDAIGAINGQTIYPVDGVPTAIRQIHGNVARGAIFNGDFTFTPCYVAKHDQYFAHGKTLKEAVEAAQAKALQGAPESERIAAFVDAHEKNVLYPNTDFFRWHHSLTGSCEAGRNAFARDHGIDMSESMTVMEFIKLTEHAYGGSTIKKLREYYE